ncbi:acetate/propionate family kinase [Brevundimonas sp. Root1279]|uniref:acetate/propionate family kinase n=1 Tax=Brevundimonas sp. Root1279 TaxID=1736443 RepID=UPI0006F32DA0|nr:acetate/propionate family kinase [Brevundimonas sp. Root1279]KQW83697.1 acetate kinase [Brevundimonas sp. Root1279]
MSACLAVLNAGSSSLKFAVYDASPGEPLLFKGRLEGIGVSPQLQLADADGANRETQSWTSEGFDHAAAAREVLDAVIRRIDGRAILGVGHRVVHGGRAFDRPVRIDPSVIAALRELSPLAPLHQPHNLAPIEAIATAAPHIAQVACFDTAFHRGQPPLAQMFALPRRFHEAGVQRYGFHGLSYEFVSGRLREVAPELAAGRVVVAHLGNGASLCAIRDGRSVASTMGFTAVDGLVMGTRSGALDPGALIHLMDEYGMDARALEDLIYKRSGLLGVSGVSSDMRALRQSGDPAAAEAIDLFVYRVVREIGSMAAALGGLDALVFTGGIGENDAALREAVASGCNWLGVELNAGANGPGKDARSLGREGAAASVWVVPTDEEQMIARHVARLLDRPQP